MEGSGKGRVYLAWESSAGVTSHSLGLGSFTCDPERWARCVKSLVGLSAFDPALACFQLQFPCSAKRRKF